MSEKVPRRLKRFYRQKGEGEEEQGYSEDYGGNDDYYNESKQKSGRRFSREEKEDDFDIRKIPSMEYEDVKIDEKNIVEIKKIEEKSLEEKLAMLEVEKFKQEKKRLPNKKESEKLADNIYTQLKETPVEELEEKVGRRSSRREERHSRREERNSRRHGGNERIPEDMKESNHAEKEVSPPEPVANIKDLFSEEEKGGAKKSKKSEFDLGLGPDFEEGVNDTNESGSAGNGDELETIPDFDETSACPSCGKKTDKIIYCPKCGAAYCDSCATQKEGKYICPKCGTKTKV